MTNQKLKLQDPNQFSNKKLENIRTNLIISYLMACGWRCARLTEDNNYADFLAISPDYQIYPIQLKGRITVARKYTNHRLYMMFPYDHNGQFVTIDHDELLYNFPRVRNSSPSLNTYVQQHDDHQWSQNEVTNPVQVQWLKKHSIIEPFQPMLPASYYQPVSKH